MAIKPCNRPIDCRFRRSLAYSCYLGGTWAGIAAFAVAPGARTQDALAIGRNGAVEIDLDGPIAFGHISIPGDRFVAYGCLQQPRGAGPGRRNTVAALVYAHKVKPVLRIGNPGAIAGNDFIYAPCAGQIEKKSARCAY